MRAPVGELALVFTVIKSSAFIGATIRVRRDLRFALTKRHASATAASGWIRSQDRRRRVHGQLSTATCTSALLWYFNAQLSLLDQEWLEEILESENGREIRDAEGNIIYKGLSRMGVHRCASRLLPVWTTLPPWLAAPHVRRMGGISGCLAKLNRSLGAWESYHKSNKQSVRSEDIFGDLKTARNVTDEVEQVKARDFWSEGA